MKKLEISKDKFEEFDNIDMGYPKIEIVYDSTKYEFECVYGLNKIILRRLKDGKIIHIFDTKITFIVECDKNNRANFMVGECSGEFRNNKLKHYIDKGKENLELESTLDISSECSLDQCQITNNSFAFVKKNSQCYSAYNSIYTLDGRTKSFKKIYNDKRIQMKFKEPTILVEQEYGKSYYDSVSDRVFYGVNPETLEINTPIWSELQQRLIPIYTEEDIKNKNIIDPIGLGETTLYCEVKKPLDEIARYLTPSKEVYTDKSEINDEFIRQFVKK